MRDGLSITGRRETILSHSISVLSSKKASYGEETYIVGADLYVENYIVCRSVNECEYTDEPKSFKLLNS